MKTQQLYDCFVLQTVAEQSSGLDSSLGISAVDSRSVPVGLMLEEVAPGQVSASTSVSSLSIIAPLLHIHSLIHSFIYSFLHSFIYSLIHWFIHSLIHSFTHTVIPLFIHSFIRSLTHTDAIQLAVDGLVK